MATIVETTSPPPTMTTTTIPGTATTNDNETVVLNMVTKYRDNADDRLRTTVDVTSPQKEEQLRTVATALCPFLYDGKNNASQKNHQQEYLSVKPLCGGLSNELFLVSAATDSNNDTNNNSNRNNNIVLVRIHPEAPPSGRSVEVVDREIENRVAAWLSEQGMAPTYFGRFENGRVEEFYQNVIPLSCHEMTSFGPQIANQMAKFHQLQAPTTILPKPTNVDAAADKHENHDNGGATIFETIEHWLSSFDDTDKTSSSDDGEDNFCQMLQTEWKWLLQQLQTMPPTNSSDIQEETLKFIREVVVTHMDCQSLNILKDNDTTLTSSSSSSSPSSKQQQQPRIRLIDFEYAGWNPRAADIANTFCEHCDMNNICADYETEYPTEEQQNAFFLSYLQNSNAAPAALLDAINNDNNNNNNNNNQEIVLATLRSEVARFTLLSHLGWSVWSVLKSKESSNNIDFDYMKYARHRMDGYELFKQKFY